MARAISIGRQSFEIIRKCRNFYVDKTAFIRDWWYADDDVTLICRPRRFGKTLNLSMLRCFLSTEYAGSGQELFGGLEVWDDPAMRALQGTIPVVSLSFARVKQASFPAMLRRINELVVDEFQAHAYLLDWQGLTGVDRRRLLAISPDMDATTCAGAVNLLCSLLARYHDAKPCVLLDEYDTPMQEAWLGGFWDEAAQFMRDLMNSTFKTNDHLGRALITGITRISRESIFSDLNNLRPITTTTRAYQTAFGFTQDEVDAALDEYGIAGQRELVRKLYDGFVFGGEHNLYNPWSITCFLKEREPKAYWANTSDNGLASSVIRSGDATMKTDVELLLKGGSLTKALNEQVVFSDLLRVPGAAWSLLLATGYITVVSYTIDPEYPDETICELRLTNTEVRSCLDQMVKGWFTGVGSYDTFVRCVLEGDVDGMNRELTDVLLACMPSFDGATRTAESQPERFYHGLVLGMLASLRRTHIVKSNSESGLGRYDVALVPRDIAREVSNIIIIEFKVFNPKKESTLEDTVSRALSQIERKAYATSFIEQGFSPDRIRKLGMAFRGKECLIGN